MELLAGSSGGDEPSYRSLDSSVASVRILEFKYTVIKLTQTMALYRLAFICDSQRLCRFMVKATIR